MAHVLLAAFDDIRRCSKVLTDGTAEEEMLRLLELSEKIRDNCATTTQEAQRIQKELDASLQSMADLETKLFHARRLLEMESKARREAEFERDEMERKICAVADLLQHERNLKDETKDKLAFLNTLPKKKRRSINPLVEEKYGNDINSTGSFLSDLSITQSEDDFLDVKNTAPWKKHRPSLSKNTVPCVGGKRSRLSGGQNQAEEANGGTTPSKSSARLSGRRRSGGAMQQTQQTLDVSNGADRISATTKVTIPQYGNGPIRAESTIESLPMPVAAVQAQPTMHNVAYKEATAPPMTPVKGLTPMKPSAHTPMLRRHNFTSKTFYVAETCMQCQKKIRFGSVGLRCRDCSIRCHTDCRYMLKVSCVPQTNTPTNVSKGLINCLSDYAPSVAPMIPALIVHCVHEIETRGLTEVGLYRVSGSEREVKALKERFLRGKTTPHLGNIDVHVLAGCVKDFLRSLREPLIPTGLWTNFCNAVQNVSEDIIQNDLYKAINELPPANRDTLAFLILHFQRIAEYPKILMPYENIARVFAPTIVGYSSPDPDQHAIFTEVFTQFTVIMNLLKIPTEYWIQYTDVEQNKENSPNVETPKQTPQKNSLQRSLYATPLMSTVKKRKFHVTPYHSSKK